MEATWLFERMFSEITWGYMRSIPHTSLNSLRAIKQQHINEEQRECELFL